MEKFTLCTRQEIFRIDITNLLARFISGHQLRLERFSRSVFPLPKRLTLTEMSSLRVEDWLNSEPGLSSTILRPLADAVLDQTGQRLL